MRTRENLNLQERRRHLHEERRQARRACGYVGRIKNSGPQVVQAPIQTTVSKKGTVKTGNDLRSGKK